MKKAELISAVDTSISETRDALQTVYDALNQGQQNKILKEDSVRLLFDRYGIEYEKGAKT